MADGGAVQGLPLSNRGVSENEQIGAIVDWLACSLDLEAVLASAGWDVGKNETFGVLNSTGANAVALAQAVAYRLVGDVVIVSDEVKRGTAYLYRVALMTKAGDYCGVVELGGPHTIRKNGTTTCRLELTGTGCREYESSGGSDHAERWLLLASLLGAYDARITRIDLAADDFSGQFPIEWALGQYQGGGFDNRGQHPKARLIDDLGSNAGRTLYVGTRQSEKQLRAYEKGKEQGDEASPWMRYEVQFGASNRRELPLDMLTDCAAYIRGAYDVLEFVSYVASSIRSTWTAVVSCAKRSAKHMQRQYGRMVNALLHVAEGDGELLHRYCIALSSSKLPKWASQGEGVHALTQVLAVSRHFPPPVGALLAV
jgi:phage replication initiation protein